jgi:hypothetical protein
MAPTPTPLDRARLAEQQADRLRKRLAEVLAERDAAIMEALSEGHNPTTVGQALGLARSTVRKVQQAHKAQS